jgi:hypothetical protein
MTSWFTRNVASKLLDSIAMRRAFAFVLRKMVGRFLARDVDEATVHVDLEARTLSLHRLDFLPEAVNAFLPGAAVHLSRGYVGTVRLILPENLAVLARDACIRVVFDDIRLELVWGADKSHTSAPSASASASLAEPPALPSVARKKKQWLNDWDATAQEGKDLMTHWIAQVT